MGISELYMSRCLELAAHGRGWVAPNPMVGAVIVADDVIIGEGFHRCYGEAHAEANAIASVTDKTLLSRSTLYVNLEPCSHYGKTPPCAELIIREKIPRVVVACIDPNPKVAGRGINRLREAGVEVVTGVMEYEATALNCFFMTAHRLQRPYIILKWAQSEDGYIDRKRNDVSEKPVQLSTSLTRMMVHQLRAEMQAIMVGVNTALLDNPSLTVRYWPGKSPIRVLIDRNQRVPLGYHLFDGAQQTLVFTQHDVPTREEANGTNVKYIKIKEGGFQLGEIATVLWKNGIHSLLVEGGSRLHRSFLEENLWDEIIVETAPVRLKEGVKAPDLLLYDDVQLVDRQLVSSGSSTGERPSILDRFVHYSK